MITTILFDLDGTLLPMDQEIFADAYIKGLATAAAPLGYEPKTFAKAVMTGTVSMVRNDGIKSNESVFWNALADVYGEKIKSHTHIFDEFYRTDFQKISEMCGFSPKAAEIIQLTKNIGFRVALATNPLFPVIATESRIKWAGLKPKDFEIYTTFESSNYCKPNLNYYREVCAKIGVSPEECLMVGNDVSDDMVAEQLGMKVFLLTDCLINKENKDISAYPQGSFENLITYIENLKRGNGYDRE